MTATFRSVLEHAIGAEGVLSIRLGSGEVRLRAVDGFSVRVRDRRDHDIADMFHVEAAEGSLSLQVEHGRGWFSGGRHTPELDVEVPRRASVVIESASGDIAADGLAGDQRYRTASGDVAIRACAGRLAVDVVSGDIDVVAAAEIDLSARTVSGDLEVRAGSLPRLRASTTSGDMKVAGRFSGEGPFTMETVSGDALVAPVGDVQIEMTTVTGDLRSDLGGRPEGGRGHRRLSIGTGGPLMTFRSLSGDLRVTRSVVLGPSEPAAMPLVVAGSSEPREASETGDPSAAAEPERPASEATSDAAREASVAPGTAPRSVAPDPAPTERSATTPWPAPTDLSLAAEPAVAQDEPATDLGTVDRTHPADEQPDDPRMDVLRALERGDIDVAEAGARLEALDTVSPAAGSSDA